MSINQLSSPSRLFKFRDAFLLTVFDLVKSAFKNVNKSVEIDAFLPIFMQNALYPKENLIKKG